MKRRTFAKILLLGVILVMSLGVFISCNEEGDEKNIENSLRNNIDFNLSNKTVDYFDKNPAGEDLMRYVNSYTELTDAMVNGNFSITPQYNEQFFETNDLIIWCFTSPIYNDIKIQLASEDDKLFIKKTYIIIDGVAETAIREWVFLIEIKKTNINKVILF